MRVRAVYECTCCVCIYVCLSVRAVHVCMYVLCIYACMCSCVSLSVRSCPIYYEIEQFSLLSIPLLIFVARSIIPFISVT